jgi:TrmH family RNA methyltransferase
MASRSTISFVRSLQQRKFRQQEGCFIVEGPKLLLELLRSSFSIQNIYALSGWEIPVEGKDFPIEIISEKELEQISALQTPNKVLAVVKIPEASQFIAPSDGLHLLIDQLQDPGNLGTIIRIADWFGFQSVICSPDTVESFNPKVVQATMGSLFRIPVYYHPLTDLLIKNASGSKMSVFATLLEGENLYDHQLSKDAFIVMGNESRGMSPLLLPFVTRAIRIPEGKKNLPIAESLNVGIATGIICAEFRRQFPA